MNKVQGLHTGHNYRKQYVKNVLFFQCKHYFNAVIHLILTPVPSATSDRPHRYGSVISHLLRRSPDRCCVVSVGGDHFARRRRRRYARTLFLFAHVAAVDIHYDVDVVDDDDVLTGVRLALLGGLPFGVQSAVHSPGDV